MEIKAETELREGASHGIDPKAEMWKLPANMLDITEQDAVLTLKLWQRFKQEIQTQSLTTIWELESILSRAIKMRQRGIRVQVKKLKYYKEMLNQKRNTIGHKKRPGIEVDIWASRRLPKLSKNEIRLSTY